MKRDGEKSFSEYSVPCHLHSSIHSFCFIFSSESTVVGKYFCMDVLVDFHSGDRLPALPIVLYDYLLIKVPVGMNPCFVTT